MRLFDALNPQLFKPLAGKYYWIFSELLMLLWDYCRTSTDYGMGKDEMIRLTEDYLEGTGVDIGELDTDEQLDENEQPPSRDLHSKAVWLIKRLRNCGWLEDLEGGYEEAVRTAVYPQVVPILQAFHAIVHPQTVTYSGKLNKAYQLLAGIAVESAPYENILKEVAGAMEELNSALRNLNASIGSYIDEMTQHKTPQEVLDLFEKYEEEIVVAAYQRFKTSDNLFNYREALLEGLDDCQDRYLDVLAADYGQVERCEENEAVGAVLCIIDRIRDDLTLMGELIAEIDKNHIAYRQRAVQRAQFMLLTDGTTQGRINSILRYYYRQYLDYDIIITNTKTGESVPLSKVSQDSSGGENQAPFYIAICASLLQIYQKCENGIRLVLLDEAFSKMTSDRIKPMMKMFRQMDLQVLLITTVEKASAIQPMCDVTYSIVKSGSRNSIAPFYLEVSDDGL